MKIELKTIVAVLIIMLVCACVFGFFVFVDDVDAQSINHREWLLEYENASGYPAPVAEPTATYYASGYPAPALEPTAKPAKRAKPTEQEPLPLPTTTVEPGSPWDLLCKIYPEISWCADPTTRKDPPYLMPLLTPTPAPTMDPSP